MSRVLERDITYPHRVDERTVKALLEVRGYRAAKVVLRVEKPITAIVDTIDSAKLQTIQPDDYTFGGSNILSGTEWYGQRRSITDNEYPKEVRDWARGKQLINLSGRIWIDADADLFRNILVVDGLWNRPGAHRKRVADFKKQEKAFREFTREWIRRYDDYIMKSVVDSTVAKRSKPIRHPKGQTYDRHSHEYFWNDALWCGDVSLDPFREFFELEDAEIHEELSDTGRETLITWAELIFNDEFRAVLPEIASVLEG